MKSPAASRATRRPTYYVASVQPGGLVPPPFRYEDYAAIPSDGRRWEVIDGEFEVNPAPSPHHQTVSRRLQFELMRVLEEPGLALIFNAPVDLILAQEQVLQPDLVILGRAREHLVTERGIEGPPDIVVEVLSPGTRVLDQRVKKGVYCRFGVSEYWLVDPVLATIESWQLAAGHWARSSVALSRQRPLAFRKLARLARGYVSPRCPEAGLRVRESRMGSPASASQPSSGPRNHLSRSTSSGNFGCRAVLRSRWARRSKPRASSR
jgi:Uma2 family endonuclease